MCHVFRSGALGDVFRSNVGSVFALLLFSRSVLFLFHPYLWCFVPVGWSMPSFAAGILIHDRVECMMIREDPTDVPSGWVDVVLVSGYYIHVVRLVTSLLS